MTADAHPLAGQGPALVVVAVGGALGALSRWGIGLAVPHQPGTFPLATFAINVVGCLLIGAVIVVVTEPTTAHPLARPFLTTGILGGFTTFSAFATDADELLRLGHVGTAPRLPGRHAGRRDRGDLGRDAADPSRGRVGNDRAVGGARGRGGRPAALRHRSTGAVPAPHRPPLGHLHRQPGRPHWCWACCSGPSPRRRSARFSEPASAAR